jgi:hypothetical protein
MSEENVQEELPKPLRKTTVVTMFFNLKKLQDQSSETRPPEFYMENGKVILSLPYPMVIFCDEETKDLLKGMRDETNVENYPTEYVVKSITEYDYYQTNFDIITENRRRSNGYKEPNRNTPSYFLLTMFKILALRISKMKNFFGTPYYAWMDFGCNHILRSVSEYAPKMLDNPRPKISVCYIHYRSHDEIKDMRGYMEYGGHCGLAAGIITAEKEYIDRFYNQMFSIFNEQLYVGYGHSEETVLAYCYDRSPELFNLYYGDYYSLLTNYLEPIQDIYQIKHFFIDQAVNKGRKDLAKICAEKVIDSITKNKIEYYSNYIPELIKIVNL